MHAPTHRPFKRLGVLCAACTLFACSTFERPAPSMPLAFAAIGADEAYLMGRQHQLARGAADANRLYRQALAADPQHVNARNGLATVLAEQGDFTGAIALWQSLTAAPGAGAGAAYLFNNLGYAYFLNGQYALAQQAQQRACRLDPSNPLVWQRLAITLDKLGDTVRAERLQRQAQALMAHDLHADMALAGGGAALTAALTAPDDGWAQVELVAGADGLLTLSRTRARARDIAATVMRSATLEITNGNGMPGMARAMAGKVRAADLRIVRLANENGFGVRHTRIEYRPPFKALAERLAAQVQPGAPVVESQQGVQADLRLVLGRDALHPASSIL